LQSETATGNGRFAQHHDIRQVKGLTVRPPTRKIVVTPTSGEKIKWQSQNITFVLRQQFMKI
jgi:hypothetical protein